MNFDDDLSFDASSDASGGSGMLPTQITGFDADGDGIADTFAYGLDTNADGLVDALDIGGDGLVDALDMNNDGLFDSIDSNGDGMMDSFDVNADGLADYFDTNSDGIVDAQDTNMDGIADMFDTNGDGIVDAADTDGDQMADLFDTDGDGVYDTSYTYSDTDNNGVVDTVTETVGQDTDNDGVIDSYVQTSYTDANEDGVPDTAVQSVFAEDGSLVDTIVTDLTDGSLITDDTTDAADDDDEDDDAMDDIDDNQVSDANDDDDIVGDPSDDMMHWEYQGDTNRCAVFAQMFAIEDLLDIDIDPDELTAMAEENGWFDDGTPPNCVGKLMEAYGLETHSGSGTIDDIANCLANDGKVIVGLDSSEIWVGPDHEDAYSPGMQADHAVEVIGIDYSDPDNPMVILNDSGTPDGAGETVPLDQFMDAWQDSGCFMVEAYSND